MARKKNYERTKLGKLIDEQGLSLKDFAELIYTKTGYIIAVTNLSNYCTGFKPIKKVETAKAFAESLNVTLNDIL